MSIFLQLLLLTSINVCIAQSETMNNQIVHPIISTKDFSTLFMTSFDNLSNNTNALYINDITFGVPQRTIQNSTANVSEIDYDAALSLSRDDVINYFEVNGFANITDSRNKYDIYVHCVVIIIFGLFVVYRSNQVVFKTTLILLIGLCLKTFAAQASTIHIVAGGGHSCALSTSNGLKCWGTNSYGQLGYGDINTRGDGANEMGEYLLPIDLGFGFNATQITAGYLHTCALSSYKAAKCWGRNDDGRLGYGDTENRGDGANEMGAALLEIDLGVGFTATQIVAGYCHTCALSTSNAVKCWGCNYYGQLGLGDSYNRGNGANQMGDALLEIDLRSGFKATQIAAGQYHTCALSTNNSVKCWGRNANGQLGYGDSNNRGDEANEMGDYLLEIDLGYGFDATQIAAGQSHTCALSRDNYVKCWGRNSYGQLGYGDVDSRGDGVNEMGSGLLEIDLGLGFTATQIVTGTQVTCALSTNGAAKCWGWNNYGQLGYGDVNHRGDGANEMGDSLLEIELGSGFEATQIVTGDCYTCALSRKHSVKCWGCNYNGQLGLGDVNSRGDAAGEMGGYLLPIDLGFGFIPTSDPTSEPTTSSPTYSPTYSPTSSEPTTYSPTYSLHLPTTSSPASSEPTTYAPTYNPTSESPTNNPSESPSDSPTNNSTNNPSDTPTKGPTFNPTDTPTKAPGFDVLDSSNNPTTSVFLFIFIQLFHSYFL